MNQIGGWQKKFSKHKPIGTRTNHGSQANMNTKQNHKRQNQYNEDMINEQVFGAILYEENCSIPEEAFTETTPQSAVPLIKKTSFKDKQTPFSNPNKEKKLLNQQEKANGKMSEADCYDFS